MRNIGFFLFIILTCTAQADCGKLVNALLKYDPEKKSAQIEQFYFTAEEFCDAGLVEANANLEIQLLSKEKKIVNQKLIFINTYSVIENLGKKDSTKIAKNKIVREPQYRNVKFEIRLAPSLIAQYKIVNRSDKQTIGTGEVK